LLITLHCVICNKGPSIKDVRTDSQKMTPLPWPQIIRTGSIPFLLRPCGHIINFKKSDVFVPKSADVQSTASEDRSCS